MGWGNTLSEALVFVVNALAGFFQLNLLFRFYLHERAPRLSHPLVHFAWRLTEPPLRLLHRLLPHRRGYDWAVLLLSWLVGVFTHSLIALLRSWRADWLASGWPYLPILGVLAVFSCTLYLFFGMILVQAVLSWVSPYHPLSGLFEILTRPLLRPIRRIIPAIAGVDLTPLFAILIIQLLLTFIVDPLYWTLLRSLLVPSGGVIESAFVPLDLRSL